MENSWFANRQLDGALKRSSINFYTTSDNMGWKKILMLKNAQLMIIQWKLGAQFLK